ATRTSSSPSASARSAARPKKAMAASPSPPAQASSALASSDDADVASLTIVERLRPDQVRLFRVPALERLVPVAGAVDGQLGDPAVDDDAVDQLSAVPLLALG